MSAELLINVTPSESRVVLIENGILQEIHVERHTKRGLVGNIYRGKVSRVLPGMQAAFVDIGLEKAAFLHASDIVIQQLDTKNFPIGGVKLYNAYPVSVQEVSLSNMQDNDATKIVATFTYDYALNTDAIASSLDAGAVLLKSFGNFKIGF